MNFLFPRFPLWDPDAFLGRWVDAVGWLFSWKGLCLWLAAVSVGLCAVTSRWSDLARGTSGVLSPKNLPLLFVGFVLAKAMHEAAHAFACKHFGRLEGGAGSVHTAGIMLLVLTPAPFVDASSAWLLRLKRHRVIVGMAGVMAEFVLASLAALLWSYTAEQTVLHGVCLNVMIVASVSTIFFNANPLLRFDAYYVVCDLLEMPNLSTRAREYVFYLVKHYVWGLEQVHRPAQTTGERWLLGLYGAASFPYKMFLLCSILLVIARVAFFVGVVLAVVSFVVWAVVPVGKFVHYLLAGGELARVRMRAVGTTLGCMGAVGVLVGAVPFPDRCRLQGVLEPEVCAAVYAKTDGFVVEMLPTGLPVGPDGPPVVVLSNPELDSQRAGLLGMEKELTARIQQAETGDYYKVPGLASRLAAVRKEAGRVAARRAALRLRPAQEGTWVAPDARRLKGAYVKRGQKLGTVATLDRLLIRAVVDQREAAALLAEAQEQVEFRPRKRPDVECMGRIVAVRPAGEKELPSAALSAATGGNTPADPNDPAGRTSAERVFEVRIALDGRRPTGLMPGAVVVVRVHERSKPLLVRIIRAVRQMFQEKFYV